MGKINIGRVILGGIVAGIVSDILGFFVDGLWLAPRWTEGMKALGHADFGPNQWVSFNLLGLVCGLALVWVYAAIRPRFGAGVKTAVYAGLAVWVVNCLLPNLGFMWTSGLFSRHLTAFTTLGGLIESIVAAIAGAALYRESAS